jgi:hypothetical protein
VPAARRWLSLLRPMRNTGLSMTTVLRPSESSTSRRGTFARASDMIR